MKADSDDNGEGNDAQNPIVVVGIFMALGFEVGGAVFAGYYLGAWVDEFFSTTPFVMIVGMLVAVVGVGIHFYQVTKRIQKHRSD
jgi:F0F1-type ATP synthase assembly protein I